MYNDDPYNSPPRRSLYHNDALGFIKAAVVGSAVTGGLYWATNARASEKASSVLDKVNYSWRLIANLSPMSIFNTFQFGEVGTAFQTIRQLPFHKKLVELNQSNNDFPIYEIGQEFLHTESSYEYLKALGGYSDEEMSQFGLFRSSEAATGAHAAQSIFYVEAPDNARTGTLRVFYPDKTEKVFVENVKPLEQFTTIDLSVKPKAVSRFTMGVFGSLGLLEKSHFKPTEVFFNPERHKENLELSRQGLLETPNDRLNAFPVSKPAIFVHAPFGPIEKPGDLWKRLHLIRSYAAFESYRFVDLMHESVSSIIGKDATHIIGRALGFGDHFLKGV